MAVADDLTAKLRDLDDDLERSRLEADPPLRGILRPLPVGRGIRGGVQLRTVIEMAGMTLHSDFVGEAASHAKASGFRPDVVVHLPGGKLIVVDAKVPLDAYLAAVEARNDAERAVHLARSARETRDYIARLASQAYRGQIGSTPELVVMFVPSDGIYHTALSEDPGLIEYGVEQQILMATPTTLIALLRAVHYGWKQVEIAASAHEIAETARELYGRLVDQQKDLVARIGHENLGPAGASTSVSRADAPTGHRTRASTLSRDDAFELAGVAFAGELRELLGDAAPDIDAVRRAARLAVAEQAWLQRLGDVWSTNDVAAMLGVSKQRVSALVKAHRLIALPRGGRPAFPAWQFAATTVDDRTALARAHLVLVEEGGIDPWSAASWFLTGHPELDGEAPVEWLQSGNDRDRLVSAAGRDAARAAQ